MVGFLIVNSDLCFSGYLTSTSKP